MNVIELVNRVDTATELLGKDVIINELLGWMSGNDVRGFLENLERCHEIKTTEEEEEVEWKAFGDVNPIQHGGQWIIKTSEHTYRVVTVDRYEDTETPLIRLGDCDVDVTDEWIDKAQVTRYADSSIDEDEMRYALDVVSYYGAQGCGGSYKDFTEEDTVKELATYNIIVEV